MFLIFLIYFLYLSVFFSLGLFVSARAKKSSTSFLVLLFIWVIIVTIIPKISVHIASQINPIPYIHEITSKKEAFIRQIQAGIPQHWEEWNKTHSFKGPDDKKYQEEFKKEMDELWQDNANKIDGNNAALDRDYQARHLEQARLAINLSRLSPASALTFSTMSLARTGLDEHEQFLASIRAYKPIFAKWIHSQSMNNISFSGRVQVKVDLTDMPQHQLVRESLGKSLARALPDIGLMVVLIIVFFAGAYFSFLKYDVR
jgi:ABC-type transport system involved in multi-copper enzyme maturation permease subunit